MIGIIGDVHFGAGYNMGKTDPYTQLNTRLLDFSNTFNNIIDKFKSAGVDAVILTGDIFETRHPTPAQLNSLSKCIRKAIKNGMQVVMNIGNHDQQRHIATTTVDVFSALDIPGLYVFQDFGVFKYKDNVSVILMPYRDRRMMHAATNAEAIEKINTKLNEITGNLTGTKIIVGHFMLENNLGIESYGLNELVLPLDMFNNYDAVIMGHIHKHKIISKKNPIIIYSGSMDKVTFGEKDHKKVSIILDPDNLENFNIIDTTTRELIDIVLDYSDNKKLLKKQINEYIKKDIDRFSKDISLKNAIVRAIIKVQENDLYFVSQPEIKAFILDKSAMICTGVHVTATNSRQLRNSEVTESLDAEKAFSLYLDGLQNEPDFIKNKLKKFAAQIIKEVG